MPNDIIINATIYCILKIFSPNSIAPHIHANIGSANLTINNFDSSASFTIKNQMQYPNIDAKQIYANIREELSTLNVI